jgi:putative membrane protein
MNTPRNRLGTRELLRALLISVITIAGCSAGQNQAPTPATNLTSAPEAAPSSAQAASKPAAIHSGRSAQTSTKQNSAIVLLQIHQTNLTEIALGQLAVEKASTDQVRAYADQLVKDHTTVDQTVVAMAQKSGAHLRDGAKAGRDIRLKQLDRKLKSARGPDFDRLFLQQTSSDHERMKKEKA